jgi:pimeloyl-ACP methyl ester carboxylesterase
MTKIHYRKADVDGLEVFYREAGRVDAPTLLLLHGFPSAGHMFRELIPALSDRFRIVAPDLPGFGQSDMPSRDKFSYTFAKLAEVIERLTEVIGLVRFSIYVFDYGAPTGFRLAVRHPERITAIISQNGNAYEEGLSDGWNPIRAYWMEASEANRKALRAFLAPETTIWQYTHGVAETTLVSPDGFSPTTSTWRVPAQMKFSSICSATIRATSRFTRNSRPISASTNRRSWRFGARTTPSSCRRVRRPSGATFRARKCVSSTPATLRSRRIATKSPRQSAIFSHAPSENPLAALMATGVAMEANGKWRRGEIDRVQRWAYGDPPGVRMRPPEQV